jgi:hypothetical protein
MLADALKFLKDLAVLAAAPQRLDLKDPRAAHFAVGGHAARIDLAKPPRDHEVDTLDDLVALANRFGDLGGGVVVWYDHEAVVLVIDDEGHRAETATLGFRPSDVFHRLVGLRKDPRGAWMNPKDFVRLLRIDLAGALPPVALLNTVRKVKFENGVTVRAETQRQRESLGKEITSAVSAEAELPEQVTVNAAVWKTPGESAFEYPVRCSVEVEPAEGLFRLLPLPDEVERVLERAVRCVGERLSQHLTDGVPAYYGRA